MKWSESCSVLSDSLPPHGLYSLWNSPVCSLSLLQEIFPTQGSNPSLPHCRRILYQIGHKGSPFIPIMNLIAYYSILFPWWLRGQSVCLQWGRSGYDPWVRKIPWRRKWQPTPVLLPGIILWTEKPGGLPSREWQRVPLAWTHHYANVP